MGQTVLMIWWAVGFHNNRKFFEHLKKCHTDHSRKALCSSGHCKDEVTDWACIIVKLVSSMIHVSSLHADGSKFKTQSGILSEPNVFLASNPYILNYTLPGTWLLN